MVRGAIDMWKLFLKNQIRRTILELVLFKSNQKVTTWNNFITKISKVLRIRISENRILSFLAFVTGPGELIVLIHPRKSNIDYLYKSTPLDDLNFESRLQFDRWEEKSRLVFRELAKSSDIVVDVGSYSGVYTLEAASVNSNLKVYAFEPNPKMIGLLRENIVLNGLEHRVLLFEEGLSLETGVMKLFSDIGPGTITSNSTLQPISPMNYFDEVLVTSLDSKNLGAVDLVKIDVEGFEEQVLMGMATTLQSYHPVILIESLNEANQLRQCAYLNALGYEKPLHLGDNNFLFYSFIAPRGVIDVLRKF